MPHNRNGRHLLVVGGTRGHGRTLAGKMSGNGWRVSIIGRSEPALANQLDGVKYFATDLTDAEARDATLARIVEQSGRYGGVAFFQRYRGSATAWEGELETSLTATRAVVEHVVGALDEEDDHAAVMIGSIASCLIADEQSEAYHVAKAGLVQLARYFAVVFGPRTLRVNCVSPGIVIKDESRSFYAKQDQLTSLYERITPLGRMGESAEVADVAAFLLSRQSSFVTGQNIIVDGGVSLQWQETLARQIACNDIPITRTA